ncbi:MAG: hypothetical protein FK730_15120 [Asgard group archaeon]|nr:hypothetical protein [Asgard group archaeon]
MKMVPFIEPRVSLDDTKKIVEYDKIAKRLGIIGFAIFNQKYKIEPKEKGRSYHSVEHISRFEINENQVESIRKTLPNKRHQYELISVRTTSAKVAQWVVKDNRVDILSIPYESLRELITQPLANVAANNKTFIELELNPLIFESKNNKSIYLRNIRRILSILLQENTPFILSCNVTNPYMFRTKRAIIALAKTIGIPDVIMKSNMDDFYNRIKLNREKLSDKMVAPGIWIIDEKSKEKGKKASKKIKSEKLIDVSKLELENLISESKSVKDQERQRYLLFEIIKETKESIVDKDFMDTFWKFFTSFYGIFNSSQSGVYLSKFDEKTSLGILRCSHQSLNTVRATLSLITKIDKMNVIVHVMKTSGTLKNLINITKIKKK